MTQRHLLLVGGGHSHVEVLRQQALARDPDVVTTLVSPAPLTPYSGMLPGLVAGLYDIAETHIALGPLAAAAGARLVEDRIVGLDLDARLAHRARGRAIPFETLSLDIGSVPAASMPGAHEHAVGVKPLIASSRRGMRRSPRRATAVSIRSPSSAAAQAASRSCWRCRPASPPDWALRRHALPC